MKPTRARNLRPVKDQEALGRVLGDLGQSRLASNLNQLAKSVHIGTLEVTPQTEVEIVASCRAVVLMRADLKLCDLARDLYIQHGWHMPRGFVDSAERNPLNFSRAEWQQARRAKQDPRALKAMFQECWAASDSPNAFQQALAARGLFLARGDRRGVVAVDGQGEVYAVARWAGIPTKAVRARLGDGEALNDVAETDRAWSVRALSPRSGR